MRHFIFAPFLVVVMAYLISGCSSGGPAEVVPETIVPKIRRVSDLVVGETASIGADSVVIYERERSAGIFDDPIVSSGAAAEGSLIYIIRREDGFELYVNDHCLDDLKRTDMHASFFDKPSLPVIKFSVTKAR